MESQTKSFFTSLVQIQTQFLQISVETKLFTILQNHKKCLSYFTVLEMTFKPDVQGTAAGFRFILGH